MTFGAVEPFLAAGSSNGYLGIEDVLAAKHSAFVTK